MLHVMGECSLLDNKDNCIVSCVTLGYRNAHSMQAYEIHGILVSAFPEKKSESQKIKLK